MPPKSSSTEWGLVTPNSVLCDSSTSSYYDHQRLETSKALMPPFILAIISILLFLNISFPISARGKTISTESTPTKSLSESPQNQPDLSGVWEIQEEDKTYQATLDAKGNGPYTHEQGSFTTTELDSRLWSGTWKQKGNDREGEFEVLLSEDYMTAEGAWWYTRVEEHRNIPPRMHGGSYFFKRLGSSKAQ